MWSIIRPFPEMVKEGRILPFVSGYRRFYPSLRIDASYYFTAKRQQFGSGLIWSILGHFFGLVKGKGRQKMISQKKTLKYIPGQS